MSQHPAHNLTHMDQPANPEGFDFSKYLHDNYYICFQSYEVFSQPFNPFLLPII